MSKQKLHTYYILEGHLQKDIDKLKADFRFCIPYMTFERSFSHFCIPYHTLEGRGNEIRQFSLHSCGGFHFRDPKLI